MTAKLRPYQQDLIAATEQAWADGARNVLMRLDTGGGKTVCLADIVHRHNGASCLIVHRSELVGQISLTLANLGIRHDVIAAATTRKAIARAHVEEIGTCYYQPGARCAVASVDTLIRAEGLDAWAKQVTLWICDEGHHLARDWSMDGESLPNKWGKAVEAFSHPDCRGLLPTATPKRADGKGLGRHADGYADVMVEGPPMRWLIDQGYLCDYRVYCPTVQAPAPGPAGASGDISPAQLSEWAHNPDNPIVGDLALNYQRFGEGGTFISFCTDIDTAIKTAEAHRARGMTAEVVTGNTKDHVRRDIFRRFGRGEVLQLCVVDIVSEGTDLPACRGASFGRPSESLALVMQQIGRTLRPLYAPGFDLSTQAGRLAAIAASDKPYAILIDHVQHFLKPHLGPPDKQRDWSLDRREKRAKTEQDFVPNKVCPSCVRPYAAIHRACPNCKVETPPASRKSPEAVEGDLYLLDPAVLAALRGDVAAVDVTDDERRAQLVASRCPTIGIERHVRSHQDRQAAQAMLRPAMGRWGAVQLTAGLDDVQMQRMFWHVFGIDCLSARALGATDAWALAERVDAAVSNG
jgi:superfamily II DNA or RNA helicase